MAMQKRLTILADRFCDGIFEGAGIVIGIFVALIILSAFGISW